jgi:hypothetical protein
MSQVASFVLGIHFVDSYFCDSRCPFGQMDNRKQILEDIDRISENLLTCGFKEGTKAVRFV